MQPLPDDKLENSWVVANRAMNRERQLAGANSYEKDLRFELVDFLAARCEETDDVGWLDLCCGAGLALVQAAERLGDRVVIDGVDLVRAFEPIPSNVTRLNFHAASLHRWTTDRRYDLITCVHGLHYIGDKLGLIERIGRWLKPTGRFLGHLDLANLASESNSRFATTLAASFRRQGIDYNRRTRILSFTGDIEPTFPYDYLGADDAAGPNYTGQDAVRSAYEYPFVYMSAASVNFLDFRSGQQ